MAAIPQRATLVEVGPRDGFQNVKAQIATEDKLAIIRQLIRSGVKQMEITSFVNPKWIPQMADAAVVAETILKEAPEDFRAIALAPNPRGVENAVKAGLKNVTYVVSASESHNKHNVNRSIDESLEQIGEVVSNYPGIKFRVSLSVAFGCPYEGEVPRERVLRILDRLYSFGIREIVLCDTVGVANPRQVAAMVEAVRTLHSDFILGLHFHDTRGMGIANVLAGLLGGVEIFETCLGGLGGCPFAPGSAGNTSTEDMLGMWNSMGIESGIDLDEFLKAVEIVKEKVEAPVTGRLANMCKAG
ncbi:MAG: hydroxymethylglutaryl-CoA lyase [Blautia sp.]|nr:hydroxymethylglutaryl-CoA lyase [Blautia sp.]